MNYVSLCETLCNYEDNESLQHFLHYTESLFFLQVDFPIDSTIFPCYNVSV